MKKVKKILGCVLAMSMMLVMCVTTYASEAPTRLGEVVDGSVLTDENASEVETDSRERGNILNRGAARISNNGNGSVNV